MNEKDKKTLDAEISTILQQKPHGIIWDDPKQSCNIQCGFDVYRLVPFKMRNQSQFILLCGVRPTYNKCFITAIFPLNIRIISYTPAYSIVVCAGRSHISKEQKKK